MTLGESIGTHSSDASLSSHTYIVYGLQQLLDTEAFRSLSTLLHCQYPADKNLTSGHRSSQVFLILSCTLYPDNSQTRDCCLNAKGFFLHAVDLVKHGYTICQAPDNVQPRCVTGTLQLAIIR